MPQVTLDGEPAATRTTSSPSHTLVWCSASELFLLPSYARSPQHQADCPSC